MMTKLFLIALFKGIVVALWGVIGHWLEQRRQQRP